MWSHLLKKSLMANFIFCTVVRDKRKQKGPTKTVILSHIFLYNLFVSTIVFPFYLEAFKMNFENLSF